MNNLYINLPTFSPNLEVSCGDQTVKEYLYNMFYPHTSWKRGYGEYTTLQFYKCGFPPRFFVNINGKDADCGGSVVRFVESYLLHNACSQGKTLMLHGACVEISGHAIVFLGDSFAGKSTLAAYLSLTGFRYITDDRVIIDTEHKLVVPFPKTVMLRRASVDLLRKSYSLKIETEPIINRRIERYMYRPTDCCKVASPLECIYILQRKDSFGDSQIENIPADMRIKYLLRYSLTPKDPKAIYNSIPLCNTPMAYLNYSLLNDLPTLIKEATIKIKP